ncbi:sugar ABC transporter ATP-binding protein [Homoserinimonas aerilata]|uniref:sugar ABC transporter ATP-binding protein n=1 Tax=Homoserinimonas aerilata TaxID=1162970 RepID=UPI00163AFED4|nr:sugar ABC transporter ATP-binding protein [Homoserinimonas aerilata]
MDGLTLRFGDNLAVDNVSFSVARGEIHGLVGHNGAGKSTVIKMLTGQLQPDSGTIGLDSEAARLRSRRAAQRQGISLVDQELSLVPALSISENMRLGSVRLGAADAGIRPRLTHVLERELLTSVGLPGVDVNTRVEELTLGQRQLVEIARALGQRPRVMILDEPTATLNETESQYVYAAVRRVAEQGCAVIFVSHRLGEVLALCDHVTVLRDARLVRTCNSAETDIATLMADMLGEAPHRLERRVPAHDEETPGLSISGLAVGRELAPFTLDASAGTIYALAGQVGSGASTVLRALGGLEPSAVGAVRVATGRLRLADPAAAAKAGVVVISNDRKSEGLFLSRSIATNLLATRLSAISRWGFIQRIRQRRRVAALAELVSLPNAGLGRPVSSLSGGNQQKVFIARTLLRDDTRVLLIDEPTRGVDVGGRAAIHGLIRRAADAGVTVLFASTELDELVDLADIIITMKDGRVVRQHSGTVSANELMYDMVHISEGTP